MDEEWPFEFDFIVKSRYGLVYSQTNYPCAHLQIMFCMKKSLLLHYIVVNNVEAISCKTKQIQVNMQKYYQVVVAKFPFFHEIATPK